MTLHSFFDIDYFRRKLWYEEVLYRTHLSNPKQLERLFKPHVNITEQHNNWYHYQKGQHTPSPQTQLAIEARLPNSL